jgi:hypothetical protein
MTNWDKDFREHSELTRRYFVSLGGVAAAAWAASPLSAADPAADPQLGKAIAELRYLTPLQGATILDKNKTGILKFPPEKMREVGLTPETWSLDVVADPASDSQLEQPLSRALGTALDWNGLMKLAEKHAVRFLHVCECTNGNDPFHTTLVEGVPLREVIWMTKPKQQNIRRVYYQGYHPENIPPFQASLPLGQILETPPGQNPPILAYKMNGELIPPTSGGPVRVIVSGTYGNKSIKWVQRVVLTNDYKANDSDGELNNDIDTAFKTRSRFINAPKEAEAGKPVALTGMAQVGISGLAKVQYCVHSQKDPWPASGPDWATVDWKDAALLPPPVEWGAMPKLPASTNGFDSKTGKPLQWPMRFTLVHWAALVPGLPAGSYDLCCRTIDLNGIAQPMPRPFLHTGVTAIHRVTLAVKG